MSFLTAKEDDNVLPVRTDAEGVGPDGAKRTLPTKLINRELPGVRPLVFWPRQGERSPLWTGKGQPERFAVFAPIRVLPGECNAPEPAILVEKYEVGARVRLRAMEDGEILPLLYVPNLAIDREHPSIG